MLSFKIIIALNVMKMIIELSRLTQVEHFVIVNPDILKSLKYADLAIILG